MHLLSSKKVVLVHNYWHTQSTTVFVRYHISVMLFQSNRCINFYIEPDGEVPILFWFWIISINRGNHWITNQRFYLNNTLTYYQKVPYLLWLQILILILSWLLFLLCCMFSFTSVYISKYGIWWSHNYLSSASSQCKCWNMLLRSPIIINLTVQKR